MAAVNTFGKGLLVLLLGLAVTGCPACHLPRHRCRPPGPPPGSPPPAPHIPAPPPSPTPAAGPVEPPPPAAAPPRMETKAEAPPVKTTAPPITPEQTSIADPRPAPVDAAKPGPAPVLLPAPPPAPPASSNPVAPAAVHEPVPPAPAAESSSPLQRLQQQAEEAAKRLDACTARLTRAEQVGGKETREEVLVCKFRKEPFSVHFKWIGQAFKDREVIYVAGQHENKIHTWLSAEDRVLGPLIKQVAYPPDSPMVRSRSRYPITTAGVWWPVQMFSRLSKALEAGDKRYGTLTYVGPQAMPQYPGKQMELVEHTVPAGAESVMPGGGKRQWYFDPETHLPLLIIAHDDRGQRVEYYCYTDVQPVSGLTDDDFNPEKLWTKR
jgi:hypothetical protein